MKALEEKILKEGIVLPGNVLKVGAFLNQKIDTPFTLEMAQEILRLYDGTPVTKVLTMESSGIPLAFAVAAKLGVPLVFAKKSPSSNQSGAVLTAPIHSYTHGNDYLATVSSEYISKNDKILLIDDFLANGAALRGLIKIIEDAGASLVGCAIAIEKGFQGGGDALREKGVRIESLAIVENMESGRITFRKQAE